MKNKNFLIIVIGQIISLFGNAIQRFSMSLYLLEFTGSAAVFSQILAISTIPYIIFAPIALFPIPVEEKEAARRKIFSKNVVNSWKKGIKKSPCLGKT